jgi:GNAT superfamily N-acetyltransferase
MSILIPFATSHQADVIRIWNAACHHDYPINEHFLAYNVIPATGETLEGRIALQHEKPAGFVLASSFQDSVLGWVGALAVQPSAQRQGIGSQLLLWAEDWLRAQGCKRVRIGGNMRPFLPGLPSAMRAGVKFFENHGYESPAHQPYEYDIARSLKDYRSIYRKPANANLVPMNPGEEHFLLDFLRREYPGRWVFEAQEFVRNGGRASDYLLLHAGGQVQGFCRITLSDSERPMERYYPQRLPEPWGQYGPLGLSKSVRGQGLGGYLIDAAACHMKSLGVDGCVIDWTSFVELYGKFGFQVYNQYISLFKAVNG